MRIAETRLQAAGERLIGEQRVEIDRRFRDADAMAFGRDGRMQIGQRLAVIEPAALRHEAFDELEDAVGAIDEGHQTLMRIDSGMVAPFVEPGFRARGVLGRRQIEESQEVARLVVRARFLEIGLALGVDEGGGGVAEAARRIGGRFVALRLDENRPARSETAEGVVEPAGDGDQLGGHG